MKKITIEKTKGTIIEYEFKGYPQEIVTDKDYLSISEYLWDGQTSGEIDHDISTPTAEKIIYGTWKVLPELSPQELLKKEGYATDYLWHVEEVQEYYECSDEEAFEIIRTVLNKLDDRFFELMEIECTCKGFKEKETDNGE